MNTSLSPKYDVIQLIDVKVKMRDGVLLSTDIFLPKAIGTFPIILTRTPYEDFEELYNVLTTIKDGEYRTVSDEHFKEIGTETSRTHT